MKRKFKQWWSTIPFNYITERINKTWLVTIHLVMDQSHQVMIPIAQPTHAVLWHNILLGKTVKWLSELLDQDQNNMKTGLQEHLVYRQKLHSNLVICR